ncbi:MAG: hypothetical protein M1355_00690 [Patescibacteria group bacterium]|nr:hypothetical protein [Patescibacteria group bacterium]MCL5093643.1 hypothetical protein [Patescibacteria group bacterium]
MKKALIIIGVVVLIAVLGGGFWWWQNSIISKQQTANSKRIEDLRKELESLKKTAKQETKNEEKETVTTNVLEDWQTYTNSTFGFSLTFPTPWEGYKVKEAQGKYIYFELPTTDPNFTDTSSTQDAGYVSMFAISVYTKAEWNAMTAEERQMEGEVITETTDYVYSWGQSQSGSDDTSARRADSESIIKTFKLK